MTAGSWLDCGMFMQNIMITARAYRLATCPQQLGATTVRSSIANWVFPPVTFFCPVWRCGKRICRRTRTPW